jgi:hypothetical protein
MILGNVITKSNRQEHLRPSERCQKRHGENRYIIKMQDVFALEIESEKADEEAVDSFFIGLLR